MPDTVQVNDGTGSKISTDEVTTVDGAAVTAQHAQRVKVGHGSDGVFDTIKAASPLEVRLYGAGGVPVSIDSDRLQVKAVSDQLPSALIANRLAVVGADMNTAVGLWNGTGADGARTTTFSSADQSNPNAKGLFVHLRISAVPGGDTIKAKVATRNAYGTGFALWESATIATAVNRAFVLYPGIDTTFPSGVPGTEVLETESIVIPKTFTVSVMHSGTGAFTYDLSYSLI